MHVVKITIMNFNENVEITQSHLKLKSGDNVPRKRQIKCGVCSGCKELQNCGICVFCIKRKTGKQICKQRKCLEILKIQLERKKKQSKKETKKQHAQESLLQNGCKLTDNASRSILDEFNRQSSIKNLSKNYFSQEAFNRNSHNVCLSNDKEASQSLGYLSNNINNLSVTQVTDIASGHTKPSLFEDVNNSKQVDATPLSTLPGCCTLSKRNIKKQKPKYSKERSTPEIIEPRTSIFESDRELIKKVRPHSAGPLPSFSTFAQALDLEQSSQQTKDSIISSFKKKYIVKPKHPKLEINSECGCAVPDTIDSGPFYNHLGSGYSLDDLKKTLLDRFNIHDAALNLRLVKPTSVEGKNGDGCPLAKWIIRRTSEEEKYLVIVRHHEGHACSSTFTVIIIVAWEGISKQYADDMYRYLTKTLNESGYRTRRRCSANESKTCLCQGEIEESQGASFSFGCSWSMFFDGCKFTKSINARKFKMQDPIKEEEIEKVLQEMTTQVSPLLKIWAPKSYENMTCFETVAQKCRIGLNEGRPFSGVTCCLDFCAHGHRDIHDMSNGTTMVCTLLKPNYNERTDEQLHVLPLYQLLDDKGCVSQCNYENPPHLIKSKIATRLETSGKYVNPVAVNVKKLANEHNIFTDENQKRSNEESFLHSNSIKHPRFCSESDIPAILSERENLPIQNIKKEVNFFVDEYEIPVYRQCRDYSTVNSETYKLPTSLKKSEHNSPCKKYKEHVSKPTIITPDMGGVAIALGHGSFLVECAKKELHATTALKNPERSEPTRLSMVFYQHKKLNKKDHGYTEYQEKIKDRLKDKILKNERSFDDLSLLADTATRSDSSKIDTNVFSQLPDIKPFFSTLKENGLETKNIPFVNSRMNSFSIASLINVNQNEESKLNVSMECSNNSKQKDDITPLGFQVKAEKLPTFSIFKKSLCDDKISSDTLTQIKEKTQCDKALVNIYRAKHDILNEGDTMLFNQVPTSVKTSQENNSIQSPILKESSEVESGTVGAILKTLHSNCDIPRIKGVSNGSPELQRKRSLNEHQHPIDKFFKLDPGFSIFSNNKPEVAQVTTARNSYAVDTSGCVLSKERYETSKGDFMNQTVPVYHLNSSQATQAFFVETQPSQKFCDSLQKDELGFKNRVSVLKSDIRCNNSFPEENTWDFNGNLFQKNFFIEPKTNSLLENPIKNKQMDNHFSKTYHQEVNSADNRLNGAQPLYADSVLNGKLINSMSSSFPFFSGKSKQFDVNSILKDQPVNYQPTLLDHHAAAFANHVSLHNYQSHEPIQSLDNIFQSNFQYIPVFEGDSRTNPNSERMSMHTFSNSESVLYNHPSSTTGRVFNSFSTTNSENLLKNIQNMPDNVHYYSLPIPEYLEYDSCPSQNSLPFQSNNAIENAQAHLPITDNIYAPNHRIIQPSGSYSYLNYPA